MSASRPTERAHVCLHAMMGNEIKHGADGAELAIQRRNLFRDEPAIIDRSMIWDVEAPGYSEARAFMSVRRAMEVALQSEIKAYDYFCEALKHVANPAVRRPFEDLRREEMAPRSGEERTRKAASR